MRKFWWMAMAAVMLVGVSSAWAKDDWALVGELTTGGRVAVNRQVSFCRLRCTEGIAIINTLVVLDGEKKHGIPLRLKLNKGEYRDVEIGTKAGEGQPVSKVNVSELVMSLQPGGRLVVYVR